jgi:hypothetical protein
MEYFEKLVGYFRKVVEFFAKSFGALHNLL